MSNLKHFFLLAVLLGSVSVLPAVKAQEGEASAEVNAVLLVTNHNHTDAALASVVSAKTGMPVLYTSQATLSSDARAAIDSDAIDTVYVLGGTLAISSVVEAELELLGKQVVRVWGVTWFGTSAKVAQEFWPEGSTEAVLVGYDHSRFQDAEVYGKVAAAAKLAASKGVPLLLTPKGSLHSDVSIAFGELGVSKVFLVGTARGTVSSDLEGLGLEVEVVGGESLDETESEVNNEVEAEARSQGEGVDLVVIAKTGFDQALKAHASASKHSVVVFVGSEDEVTLAVSAAQERDADRIIIVGDAELAASVETALVSAGFEVEVYTSASGRSAVQAWENNRERLESFKARFEARAEAQKERIASHLSKKIARAQELLERVREDLEAEGALTIEIEAELNEAEADLEAAIQLTEDGEYRQAFTLVVSVEHELRKILWENLSQRERDDSINEESDSRISSENRAEIVASLQTKLSILKDELVEVKENAGTEASARVQTQIANAERAINRFENVLNDDEASVGAMFGAYVSARTQLTNAKFAVYAELHVSIRSRIRSDVSDFRDEFRQHMTDAKTLIRSRMTSSIGVDGEVNEGSTRFEFEAECGDEEQHDPELEVTSEDCEVRVRGDLFLANPCFNATHEAELSEDGSSLGLTVSVDAADVDACTQCVGKAEFEYRLTDAAFNESVDVTVEVLEGAEVTATHTSTVELSC